MEFNFPVHMINEPTDHGLDKSCSTPLHRKDKSRMNAQSRRTTHAQLLKELGSLLPFPAKVVQQIDYNSILRLVLCYFRMKNLAIQDNGSSSPKAISPLSTSATMSFGKMQDLMTEALDGFVLVLLGDGTIVYLSENVHKYLGLFQSEHIGTNVFDLILNEDHKDVKDALKRAEMDSMSRLQDGAPCSFFCRMKCPKFKMAMCAAKSPGYKLMYVSGHFRMDGTDPRVVAVVRPVSPPSILEIRMEGNMFVTHYQLDMRCSFFDGRLQHLLGYSKSDMLERLAFDLHHHEDIEPCQKCHAGLLQKGEGVSGYYRMLNKYGQFIWCQTRAHMMFDSRTGKPNYIVCMNFIISKKDGEASLAQRAIEAPKEANFKNNPAMAIPNNDHSYDPFPVTSDEWSGRNPFANQPTRRLSPEQEEPDSTVKSRTPSPSAESFKSPQNDGTNASPQMSDQLSVDTHYNTTISPIPKRSVSSNESGYESTISTSPNSVQMRDMNAPSPVFHQKGVPDLIPAQTDSNMYFKQKPQFNFAQSNSQEFQNPFQPPKNQYQAPSPNFSNSPTTDIFNRRVKQEPSFAVHQCAGNKRNHQSMQQPSVSNTSEDLSRNSNSLVGIDMVMTSFDDSIPSVTSLHELKTEDLDILDVLFPSRNAPQMQQSTQWPQNMEYIPNGGEFNVSKNHMMRGDGEGKLIFNPQQQQHQQEVRTGVQPQFLYRNSQ